MKRWSKNPVHYSVGHTIPALLSAVLELFPLDSYVLAPVSICQLKFTGVPDTSKYSFGFPYLKYGHSSFAEFHYYIGY